MRRHFQVLKVQTLVCRDEDEHLFNNCRGVPPWALLFDFATIEIREGDGHGVPPLQLQTANKQLALTKCSNIPKLPSAAEQIRKSY